MKERLAILKGLSIAFVTVLAALPCRSQPTIEGVILDSNSHPVAGVDVSLLVPGRRDAVQSQRSDSAGKYSFNIQLTEAFDIFFMNSRYQVASVSRLAERDNQHISKVIYLKGEPTPSTAVDDQLHSAQRVNFLAASLSLKDRESFLSRFDQMEIWTDPNRRILTNEVPGRVRVVWQSEASTIQQQRTELLKSE
jgi:hypothetical protein